MIRINGQLEYVRSIRDVQDIVDRYFNSELAKEIDTFILKYDERLEQYNELSKQYEELYLQYEHQEEDISDLEDEVCQFERCVEMLKEVLKSEKGDFIDKKKLIRIFDKFNN